MRLHLVLTVSCQPTEGKDPIICYIGIVVPWLEAFTNKIATTARARLFIFIIIV
jgi:hypothetical protein